MRTRHWLGTSLFLAGLAINPAYFAGCSAEEDDGKFKYDFGEAEVADMLAALNETGVFMFEGGGTTYSVELALERTQEQASALPGSLGRSPVAASARACGTTERLFSHKVAACVSFYRTVLPVQGTLSISRNEAEKQVLLETLVVDGELEVSGHRLESARSMLTVGAKGRVTFALFSEDNQTYEFMRFEGSKLGADKLDLDVDSGIDVGIF